VSQGLNIRSKIELDLWLISAQQQLRYTAYLGFCTYQISNERTNNSNHFVSLPQSMSTSDSSISSKESYPKPSAAEAEIIGFMTNNPSSYSSSRRLPSSNNINGFAVAAICRKLTEDNAKRSKAAASEKNGFSLRQALKDDLIKDELGPDRSDAVNSTKPPAAESKFASKVGDAFAIKSSAEGNVTLSLKKNKVSLAAKNNASAKNRRPVKIDPVKHRSSFNDTSSTLFREEDESDDDSIENNRVKLVPGRGRRPSNDRALSMMPQCADWDDRAEDGECMLCHHSCL
jgi:hypothetical protein